LHPKQQIVADGPEGMDVVLHLIPTQELLTQLLGYGADLKVIAPLSLQEKMRQVLRQSLAAYE
jgi:predicted DNA-binding transcriptional regulator YafY